MKKFFKLSKSCIILIPILLLTLGLYSKVKNIPGIMFLREGVKLDSGYLFTLSEEKDSNENNTKKLVEKNTKINYNYNKVKVSLLGLLPVKALSVKTVPTEIKVYPGGQPVGVKLNTKGVLVVALSDIQGNDGVLKSPAAVAGVQIGDSILKINDNTINSSEELAKYVNYSEGKEMSFLIDRKGIESKKKVLPIISTKDNKYKIGLWVRDSTAGVGTLTFYDENSGAFGALGHPITDLDTGTTLAINKGEIVSSSIINIKKGVRGNPGELKGIFVDEDTILGNISKNTECGIFGTSSTKLINNIAKEPLSIALRTEIKEGPAKILTTLDGNEPKYYDIQIEKLLAQDIPGPKSMIIKITDQELLDKTGGIVQGMSGSPIIQNNKIVGAVTHVLVNRPDVGYGIYIEWMLKDANIIR